MRPHLIVTLKPSTFQPRFPYWGDMFRDKTGADHALSPGVARALRDFGLTAWTAQEYPASAGGWSAKEVGAGLNRIYRVILHSCESVPAGLVEAIRLLPEVAEARPGIIGTTVLPPVTQMGGRGPGDDQPRRQIYLPEARRISSGSPDIKVAVLDTGISLKHPALVGNLDPGMDFVDIIDGQAEFIGDFIGADDSAEDEVGHGTHVAGIIGACAGNVPAGVAPRCRILPVRVLAAMRRGAERVGAGLIENINAGVKWAVDQGAHIINMSLGVQRTGGGLPHHEVVAYAAAHGVTIIAAAGNDGHEALYYPGALPEVIAVGSVSAAGEVSEFSTFGPQVALVAPGEDIYSAYLDNGYAHATGTSHSSPFVAGAAALLQSIARQQRGRFSPRDIRKILTTTADRLGRDLRDRRAGAGQLNLVDALQMARSMTS